MLFDVDLEQHAPDARSPLVSKSLQSTAINKMNWRLLPLTLLIVQLSYVDRGNLGLVAPDMCTELNMNNAKYGVGVASFGLGYIITQVPSNYLMGELGARVWFTFLAASWGVVRIVFSSIKKIWQYYLMTFLMGLAEGGTASLLWHYLPIFYPNAHLTLPYAVIESSIGAAIAISSPLAVGLLSFDGLFGLEGWRILFLFEGFGTILISFILYFITPSNINETGFLSEEEKEWILSKRSGVQDTGSNILQEICTLFKSVAFWMIFLSGCLYGVCFTALNNWTALIIDEMLHKEEGGGSSSTCSQSGSADTTAIWLTAVPFAVTSILCLLAGIFASNVKNRSKASGILIVVSVFLLCGWVLLRKVSFAASLLSLSLSIGVFYLPLFLIAGILISRFGKETGATASALYNLSIGFGYVGGPMMIGPLLDNSGYGVTAIVVSALALCSGLALFSVKDPLMDIDVPSTELYVAAD